MRYHNRPQSLLPLRHFWPVVPCTVKIGQTCIIDLDICYKADPSQPLFLRSAKIRKWVMVPFRVVSSPNSYLLAALGDREDTMKKALFLEKWTRQLGGGSLTVLSMVYKRAGVQGGQRDTMDQAGLYSWAQLLRKRWWVPQGTRHRSTHLASLVSPVWTLPCTSASAEAFERRR